MTTRNAPAAHKEWTRRELDAIFNQHAPHLEAIAREMSDAVYSVDVDVDQKTQKPVINFVFAKGTTPDLQLLPPQIGGHAVSHRFGR